MAFRIDDDENRIQDLTDKVEALEVQTFSPEVVARNESTRNTGVESGDSASLNPYPQWIPIRDFGTLGNLTIDIVLNRVDSHIAKMTLNGDADFAFTIPPGVNKMMEFILDVTIDATGGYTINLLNNILPAGITINNTANARTVIRFTTTDGGVTYYAEDLTSSGGGGTGDVVGPGSSTNNAIARFDGLTGKIIKDSTVIVSDTGAITEVGGIDLFANAQANPISNVDHVSFISDLAVTRGQIGRSDFFAGTEDGLVLNVPATQHFSISKDTVEKILYDADDDQLRFTDTDILAAGAGRGVLNIGRLDFIDNLATPVASVSLYSDGIDLFANTGGGVVNFSDIADGIFLDSTFRIQGSGDQTKQLAFEVDTFTTATTRTFTFPDADGTVFITPAQDNLDLNTFDIFDIDKLTFMNFASTGSSLNIGFSALGSGGFRGNVLNNGIFEITEENILHFSFDGNTNSINIVDSLFNVLETVGSTSYQIAKFNGETILNEPTQIQQQIAGVDIFTITSSGIDMQGSNFITTPQIGFSILGNIIEDDVNGMKLKTPIGDDFEFSDGTDIFATLDKDLFALQFGSIMIPQIVVPADPPSNLFGKVFYNMANNRLSFIRRNDGDTAFETINVEAGGGDGIQEFEIPTADLNIDGDVQEIFISNSKQGYEVGNASAFTEDIANYFPVYVGQRGRVTDLGWNNLETGAGTITFTMALYDNIGGGVNYPGTRIVVDTSSTVTGAVQTALTNSLTPTNIEAGLYWIGIILTDLQIGSIASCSRHETAGANSAGYFDDEGNTDVMLSILGFTEPETSLPSTADSEMAALTQNPPAVFMRLIPNTS